MKKVVAILLSVLCMCACSADPDRVNQLVEKDSQTDKTKEEAKDTIVSFVGVGDNLIHNSIYEEADREAGAEGDGQYSFAKMYEPMKQDIQNADLAFINQETILGGDELGLSGYPTFNTPSAIADDVEAAGFDLVNTATNHCLDKWQTGIDHSAAVWGSKEGIIAAGTYTSQEDRDTIRTIKRKGITFSFLAYTYGTNGVIPEYDYSVAYFDDATITNDVKKAKEISDVVIVSAHWGTENDFMVNEEQQHYAQLFADLGVDVVIGTHPHVIQKVEWVKGSAGNEMLTVYSLGNFLSGMLEVDNVLGGMISFDFVQDHESKKISVQNVRWIPLVTHYEGDAADIMNTRHNYRVYRLDAYSEAIANKHGLNGYEGQSVTIAGLQEKTAAIIDDQFLKEEQK